MSGALSFLQSVAGFARSRQAAGSAGRPNRLAVVDPAYAGGPARPKVTFEGESTMSGKEYPFTVEPAAGDRVLMVPVGTTYLIAGVVQ